MRIKAIMVPVIVLAVVGLVAATGPLGAQQQGKIGVIDNDRLLQESVPGRAAAEQLQAVVDRWQGRIQERTQQINELRSQRAEQALTLSQEALVNLDRRIEQGDVDVQRMQDDAQRELNRVQPQILAELEQTLMPLVERLAREQGYDLLFNTQTPGLLYFSNATDLTDALIALTATATGGGSQ